MHTPCRGMQIVKPANKPSVINTYLCKFLVFCWCSHLFDMHSFDLLEALKRCWVLNSYLRRLLAFCWVVLFLFFLTNLHRFYLFEPTFPLNALKRVFTLYQMALSAASPFYRGHVSDIDCRWGVISASVDDRTQEERGLKVSRWTWKRPGVAMTL